MLLSTTYFFARADPRSGRSIPAEALAAAKAPAAPRAPAQRRCSSCKGNHRADNAACPNRSRYLDTVRKRKAEAAAAAAADDAAAIAAAEAAMEEMEE